jgi:hypothetical protein
VDGGGVIRLLDAANLTRPRDFYRAAGEAIKKTAQSWRVSDGFPL